SRSSPVIPIIAARAIGQRCPAFSLFEERRKRSGRHRRARLMAQDRGGRIFGAVCWATDFLEKSPNQHRADGTDVRGTMKKTGTANPRDGISRLLRPALLPAALLSLMLLSHPLAAEPDEAAVTLEKTGSLPRAEPDPAAALALRRDSTRRELETLSQSIS